MEHQRRHYLRAGGMLALAGGLFALQALKWPRAQAADLEHFAVSHTDAEWRAMLSNAAYTVLRHEGTERPFSSPLNEEHRAGQFFCAGCQLALFSSRTKFDSGTGWPSFWQPLEHAVASRTDSTFGMERTEIHCTRCGGHLGHVFDDGPKPTGLRYCMNGVAMTFTAGRA